MRLALVLCSVAAPVLADSLGEAHPQSGAILKELSGLGCTLGPESYEILINKGYADEAINAVLLTARADGLAAPQGDYTVFDASACSIRLPDITSDYSINDPELQAIAPFIREESSDGDRTLVEEGCFFEDLSSAFTTFNNGDHEAGFADFIAFIGSSTIAGDVRFYQTNPLVTPRGFQITTGDCGKVANIDDIRRSHDVLTSGFDDYVRFVGANTICGEPVTMEAGPFLAELQGYDFDVDHFEQPQINAYLNFELQFITMAAGWHEGMSATSRGTPRPPLCHYAD